MPPLNVLLKPASSSCNLKCTYCFYADEAKARTVSNCGIMPDNICRVLINKAVSVAEGSISFLFQGGEPTLVGIDFYRRFVAMVKDTTPTGLSVHYAIQTNGTLLDQAWCEFFAENQFLVGVSLDGNRQCHDRFRQDQVGKGTYNRVLRATRLLDRNGIEYNVLTVVTGHLARHIQSVFASLCKEGFRYQQYIPCLDPIQEVRGGHDFSLSPTQYALFLKQLFDLWYRELIQGHYYSIRYFDNLIWMLRGYTSEQCSMYGCCAAQYLVEADGSVYPCDFYGLDEYRLGNVCANTWEELDQTRTQIGFIEMSRPVPDACRSCRWYPICRNGCRRDRLSENGKLGQNYYCKAYASFFDYAMPRLKQIAQATYMRC